MNSEVASFKNNNKIGQYNGFTNRGDFQNELRFPLLENVEVLLSFVHFTTAPSIG
jgi:hypothetical protein